MSQKIKNNLKGLFSNLTNWQSIDLSGLYMNKIIYYDSLFDGCSSLEEVNFPINTFSDKSNIYEWYI